MLRWFEDPAHGWLRVPLEELGGFKPSEYSYRGERYAYLEEDCDALGWADTVGRREEALSAPVSHTNGDSSVRRKERFPA
jgi:hypothetical protein